MPPSAAGGNAGGGVTQSVMPLIFGGLAAYGFSKGLSWRYAQIVPGVLMLIVAVLYYKYTQDTPEGNFSDMRKAGLSTAVGKKGGLGVMAEAGKNYRVWLLGACYGASFGVELFVHSVAVTYYFNKFHMSVEDAGYAVGAFGLLALFARALGGIFSDRVARSAGLQGRTWLLFALMMGEGIFLIAFSTMNVAALAVTFMIVFGLFTHMACGSLYALVPFIDRKCLGGRLRHHRRRRQHRRRCGGLPAARHGRYAVLLQGARHRGDLLCHRRRPQSASRSRSGRRSRPSTTRRSLSVAPPPPPACPRWRDRTSRALRKAGPREGPAFLVCWFKPLA